jgi:cobalt-zinc-cadmium efflux system outer membrane protein
MRSILFGLLTIFLKTAEAESLDYYLKQVLDSNPEIMAKRIEIDMMEARVKQAGILPDPKLLVGGGVSPVETRLGPQKAKVSISQQLPWFGSLRLEKEWSEAEVSMKRQEFKEVVDSVWYQIIVIWIEGVEKKLLCAKVDENNDILEQQLEIMQQKYEQGLVPMTDILKLEIQLERNSIQKQLLVDDLDFISEKFYALLGQERADDIEFWTEFDSSFLERDPRTRWYKQKIDSIDKKEAIIKKQNNPSMVLSLDYLFIGEMEGHSMADNGRDALMPMIGISLPIHIQKNKARVEEITLQKQVFEFKEDAFESQLQLALERTYYHLKKMEESLQSIERELALEEMSLVLLEQAYQDSGRGFDSLLNKQQEQLQLDMQKISLEKEYLLAKATQNKILGVEYVSF